MSAASRKLEVFLPLSGQDALGANFPTQGSLIETFLMIAVEFNLAPIRVHLTPKLILKELNLQRIVVSGKLNNPYTLLTFFSFSYWDCKMAKASSHMKFRY